MATCGRHHGHMVVMSSIQNGINRGLMPFSFQMAKAWHAPSFRHSHSLQIKIVH